MVEHPGRLSLLWILESGPQGEPELPGQPDRVHRHLLGQPGLRVRQHRRGEGGEECVHVLGGRDEEVGRVQVLEK